MKLVMWLLLGLLVYWALRVHAKHHRAKFRDHLRSSAQEAAQTNSSPPSSKSSATPEKMVACAYCQIYLPISEAVRFPSGTSTTGAYFCCEEHAKVHSPVTNHSPSAE